MKWWRAAIAYMQRVAGMRTDSPAGSTALNIRPGQLILAFPSSESLEQVLERTMIGTPIKTVVMRQATAGEVGVKGIERELNAAKPVQMRLDGEVNIREAALICGRTVVAIKNLRQRKQFPEPIRGGGYGDPSVNTLYWRREDVVQFAERKPARATRRLSN